MRDIFLRIKDKISKEKMPEEDEFEEYIPIRENRENKAKVVVRSFNMSDFEDIKPVLNSLREGYTVALINIRELRNRDIIELKRAIDKLKKTCDAIEGDIAGFGDDYIIATPSFAEIYRSKDTGDVE